MTILHWPNKSTRNAQQKNSLKLKRQKCTDPSFTDTRWQIRSKDAWLWKRLFSNSAIWSSAWIKLSSLSCTCVCVYVKERILTLDTTTVQKPKQGKCHKAAEMKSVASSGGGGVNEAKQSISCWIFRQDSRWFEHFFLANEGQRHFGTISESSFEGLMGGWTTNQLG